MEVVYFILLYTVVVYRALGNTSVAVNLLLSLYGRKDYGVSFMPIWIFDLLIALISTLVTYKARFDMIVLIYGLLLLFMSNVFIFVAIFLIIRNEKK